LCGWNLRRLAEWGRNAWETLGVEPTRIGLWAASGNVPTALDALRGPSAASIRAAALP
jgi:hypothetical protein